MSEEKNEADGPPPEAEPAKDPEPAAKEAVAAAATATSTEEQPSQAAVSVPPPAPTQTTSAPTGVVWRLQYVPTVVFGDGTSAAATTVPPGSIPAGALPPGAVPAMLPATTTSANGSIQVVAPPAAPDATASADTTSNAAASSEKPATAAAPAGKTEGDAAPAAVLHVPTAEATEGQAMPAATMVLQAPPSSAEAAAGAEGQPAVAAHPMMFQTGADGQPQLVQIQAPDGQPPPAGFPQQAYLVAPPNFAASLAAQGQNITIALPPNSGPIARVSNDPNQSVFTLDLSEDNNDLPLPMEDEVDLSSYNYKINLGKDVVSGKGGKVQQLNRHFRNMVAAAYPTYDSTSSKISKRKIGLKIYQAIIDRGGRFLDLEGNPMDRPKSILKVMKALKDAKTWTSDAKRMAKRKREEQKLMGHQLKPETKRHRSDEPLALPKEQPLALPKEPLAVPIARDEPMEEATAVAVAVSEDTKPPPVAVPILGAEAAAVAAAAHAQPPKAAPPVSPSTSLLEKRGQTLPTKNKREKKETAGEETAVTQEETEQQAQPQEQRAEAKLEENPPELAPPADVEIAAAAAAAAEVVAEGDSAEAVLKGLQLLTKAAGETAAI